MAAARTFRPSALLVVAAVGCLLSGCGEKLTEYRDEQGKFRIRLPGTPRSVRRGLGSSHAVRLAMHSGDFEVAWRDVGASKESAEEILDGACKRAVEGLEGKELRRKSTRLDGNPGRELLIEAKEGKLLVRLRIYLVDRRLYQVTAGGSKWWVEQNVVERVLDSFEVLE